MNTAAAGCIGLESGTPVRCPPFCTGAAAGTAPAAAGMGQDGGAGADADRRPDDTWAFLIDVSGSMGSTRAWEPSSVLRLCYALASLACVVDTQVKPGDWVMIAAFDDSLVTLKHWFQKPECTLAVRTCGLCRGGTCLFGSMRPVLDWLTQKAADVDSATAAANSGWEQQHHLVVLTDGEATDPEGFEAAAAQLREPRIPEGTGFKALLMQIDHNSSSTYHDDDSGGLLRQLGNAASGASLPYVQLLELQLPASLDLRGVSSIGLLRRRSPGAAWGGSTAVAGMGIDSDDVDDGYYGAGAPPANDHVTQTVQQMSAGITRFTSATPVYTPVRSRP